MRPVNLFISHAPKDEEYKDQLLRHLSSLIRNGWINQWNEAKIALGADRDASIKTALNESELILFLISADFMACNSIFAKEMKWATQHHRENQATIIPIFIRACVYSIPDLDPFENAILPKDKNPICSWDNRDQAWLDVVNGITEKVKELRDTLPEPPSDSSPAPATPVLDTGIIGSGKKTINSFHRFTCDRVKHQQSFTKSFKKKERTQFFYLYGGDMQSHLGMFNRITYELEGRMQDYLNPALRHEHQALRIELTFDPSDDVDYYKENVLKSLFASFCIPVNEHGPLIEKDLAFAYDKSSNLKGLKSTDFACIFISISDYEWDAEITPQVTRWFINEFCNCRLSLDAPNFLFFFAIKYEDGDKKIKKEIETIAEESKSIRTISELDMVSRKDIRGWFNKYGMIAPSSRDRRALMDIHFGQDEESYMEDVELAFQQIIDEYNKKQQ